jgi:hypothetical protein
MPVAKLDNAPRCRHTKMNGQPCSAPARRHRKYCVFHEAAHAKRPDQTIRLVEDAMSLQFALFQVMRSLDDHSIDPKRAALKLYALQIASSNLKRLQQEIDYVPSDDPARQQSLLELLLDKFEIPRNEDEWERARAEAPGEERPIADALNPASPTFTIKACADPDLAAPGLHPRSSLVASGRGVPDSCCQSATGYTMPTAWESKKDVPAKGNAWVSSADSPPSSPASAPNGGSPTWLICWSRRPTAWSSSTPAETSSSSIRKPRSCSATAGRS